jgi:hypothetical protein
MNYLRSSELVFNFNSATTIHLCMVKAFIYNIIPARQSYVRPFSLADARFSLVNVVAVRFVYPLYIMYKKKRCVSHDGIQQDAVSHIRMKNYLQLVSGSSWMRQPLTCFLGRITLHFETVSLSRVSSHFAFITDNVFFFLSTDTTDCIRGFASVFVCL